MAFSISSLFPLYEVLRDKVKDEPDVPFTDEQIKTLSMKIRSLDKYGRDMIFVWVRIHSLKTTSAKLLDIPYGGEKLDAKSMESDTVHTVKFDMRQFPPVLHRMLDRFCDLHLTRMAEEAQRAAIDESGGTAIRPSPLPPTNPQPKPAP
jgi:hypothetical protein